jgi:hypothetical protein
MQAREKQGTTKEWTEDVVRTYYKNALTLPAASD